MGNFALIGAAGYIAPRHMKAIKETNGELIAALDPNDSVGIIDSYFPDAMFFTKYEQFDSYLRTYHDELKKYVDYISICSPNYLHDSHVRIALRTGTNVICEKPLLLDSEDIDTLKRIEKESGKKVNTILQLRLHPSIIALRNKILSTPQKQKHEVDLTYITSRGDWYLKSWKGDERKSGGIATNIGVHFFDMLHFLFGNLQTNIVHYTSPTKAAGYLEYESAKVRWFLSIDLLDVPEELRAQGQRTYRSITCDNNEIEFSGGFTDLHTKSYEEILKGNGFGLEENRVAIDTVSSIRKAHPIGAIGDYHPFIADIN